MQREDNMIKISEKHSEQTLKISEGDKILFRSLCALCDIGVPYCKAASYLATTFRIAKRRLRLKKKTLCLLYTQKWVPFVLREIMLSFVVGEIKEREARNRIKACIAKYKRWAAFSA